MKRNILLYVTIFVWGFIIGYGISQYMHNHYSDDGMSAEPISVYLPDIDTDRTMTIYCCEPTYDPSFEEGDILRTGNFTWAIVQNYTIDSYDNPLNHGDTCKVYHNSIVKVLWIADEYSFVELIGVDDTSFNHCPVGAIYAISNKELNGMENVSKYWNETQYVYIN